MSGTRLVYAGLAAVVLVAALGAQEQSYALSGTASFTGAGAWLDDGAFQATDLGWASDSAVETAAGLQWLCRHALSVHYRFL